MKKIVLAVILALLMAPIAFAKTGGPIECVGEGKLALSLEAEYIQEQRMRPHKINTNIIGVAVLTDHNNLSSNFRYSSGEYFLKVNYGLFDNLDVFFKCGMSKNEKKYDAQLTSLGLFHEHDFNTDYAFAWSAGFNSKLFSVFDWFDVGSQVQFSRSKPKEKSWEIIEDGALRVASAIEDIDAKYYSWNVALYFYKSFKLVTPYIGAKYQYSKYSWKGDYYVGGLSFYSLINKEEFVQDMPWILFGGFDVHINKRLDANIEVSTFGARSISAGVTWRF